MKGKKVYECKTRCEELGKCCHNTKNRVIEKMCEVDKDKCKKMGKFLKCLLVCECLCSYICTCCCEHEEVSGPCFSELCGCGWGFPVLICGRTWVCYDLIVLSVIIVVR